MSITGNATLNHGSIWCLKGNNEKKTEVSRRKSEDGRKDDHIRTSDTEGVEYK